MAKAKINPAETVTKVVETKPETITLTLSREEAEYIAAFSGLDTANGNPWRVFNALCNAGVEFKGTKALGSIMRDRYDRKA